MSALIATVSGEVYSVYNHMFYVQQVQRDLIIRNIRIHKLERV